MRTRDTRKTPEIVVGKSFYYHQTKPQVDGSVIKVGGSTGALEICLDESHGRPPYRVGGPLFLAREHALRPVVASGTMKPWFPVPTAPELSGYRSGYAGGFVLTNLPPLSSLGVLPTTQTAYSSRLNPDNLNSLGSKAYGRLRPKVEKAGVAQALYELKDLPGMLKTSAKGFSDLYAGFAGVPPGASISFRPRRMTKKAAGHFLNHVFGWVPFVKDLKDVLDVTDQYFTTVAQLTAQNGQWQSKRFFEDELLTESLVMDVTRTTSSPLLASYFAPSGARSNLLSNNIKVYRQQATRIWYEGKFLVYRPEFDPGVPMHPQIRSVKQALSVYGAKIDPMVLYKITPWSWLIDWFSNTGSVLQELMDSLTGEAVSKYMYLMRHTFDRYKYVCTQTHSLGNASLSGETYWQQELKVRVPASTSFGFTLPVGGLSGKQMAILAALGISSL
jgi:hypothetical protein